MTNDEGWTVETLRTLLMDHMLNEAHSHEQRLIHLKDLLDERYTAQQSAMTTAFSSAQREVQAALASAEKAVAKAEVAADKRFEAVNEFRAQLSDQATRFYTRVEAEAAHHAISDKVDADETRTLTRFKDMSTIIGVLSSRLDLAQGITVGATTTKVETRLDRSSVLALYGFVLSIFLAAFAVITYLIAR